MKALPSPSCRPCIDSFVVAFCSGSLGGTAVDVVVHPTTPSSICCDNGRKYGCSVLARNTPIKNIRLDVDIVVVVVFFSLIMLDVGQLTAGRRGYNAHSLATILPSR